MDRKLEKLYEQYGFPSASTLYQIAIDNGLNATRGEVKKFVDSQEVHQIHAKRKRKSMTTSAIVAPNSNMYYQADLLDLSGYKGNGGFNWILLMTDIFNRRCVARPLKTKSVQSVKPAFIDCVEEFGKPFPMVITTDQGNEFMGSVDKWLTHNGILHLTARVGDHNQLGIIDRLSRTIKERIWRMFSANGNHVWKRHLNKIIDAYNNTPHAALFYMTPNEAHRFPSITIQSHEMRLAKAMKKRQTVYKVGDKVRIKIEHGKLTKGYLPQFSKAVHTVVGKDGNYYRINDGSIARAYQLRSAR